MEYHIIKMILDFLSSIFWPLIILIIFFSLKEPIKNFINNIKKFTYGNAGIETNSANNQSEENSLIELLGNGQDASNLDKILAKFSETTLSKVEKIIENETQISTVEAYQNKYERIYKYSKLLVLVKSLEKVYETIYGSQIKLLQKLNSSHLETKNDLKIYYDNAVKINPEGYKNYAYENYLNFLYQNSLIEIDDNDNVNITDYGKDFLRYIVEANLSFEKYN
jgi:hypothetical protein